MEFNLENNFGIESIANFDHHSQTSVSCVDVTDIVTQSDGSSAYKSDTCDQCHRRIRITKSGSLYIHGPRSNRCPASGTRIRHSQGEFSDRPAFISSADSQQSPSSSSSFEHLNCILSSPQRLIRHIPRGARPVVALRLSSIIEAVASSPGDLKCWTSLMFFARSTLAISGRSFHQRTSLTSQLKLACDAYDGTLSSPVTERFPSNPSDPAAQLRRRVELKLEDGDIRGALRIAVNGSSLASSSEASVLECMERLHPARSPTSIASGGTTDFRDDVDLTLVDGLCTRATEQAVLQAIRSFPPSSAAGMDGLSPAHLRDLTGPSASAAGSRLLSSLAKLVRVLLRGEIPSVIASFLCGAKLLALPKKGGSFRPIAIGCTLRRLAAKVAVDLLQPSLINILLPNQVGVGVPMAVEGTVHSARLFLQSNESNALLKLDFHNAFNCLDRSAMITTVSRLVPELLPFVTRCYASDSSLLFGSTTIPSSSGVQQGDPLGPLLFALTINSLTHSLESPFNVWYLDDGNLGGPGDLLRSDITRVLEAGKTLGLELNTAKCEIITDNPAIFEDLNQLLPGLKFFPRSRATLLGCPVGDTDHTRARLENALVQLRDFGAQLSCLRRQDALLLLTRSLSLPRVVHLLRASPCFDCPDLLRSFDDLQLRITSEILNVRIDGPSATQALMPIRFGGLGLQSAFHSAIPAFVSSVISSAGISTILLNGSSIVPASFIDDIVSSVTPIWRQQTTLDPPEDKRPQRLWMDSLFESRHAEMVRDSVRSTDRIRLLALKNSFSGAFLEANPSAAFRTKFDDTSFSLAVALRLGQIPPCSFKCACDAIVEPLHSLNCRNLKSRHNRHTAVNQLISQALRSAGYPARLEPSGLCRSDGKRPDGISLVPWNSGRLLVWDFTCPNPLAPSWTTMAARSPNGVSTEAERRKRLKYTELDRSTFEFVPLAIDTLGHPGESALEFLRVLGRRLEDSSQEPRSGRWLLQRISAEIQRGNCASILEAMSADSASFALDI